MKKIGGYFPYEALLPEKNNFLEGLCPDTGDLRYLMSGRCAIYYALEDYKNTDMRRIAYVPIYTCCLLYTSPLLALLRFPFFYRVARQHNIKFLDSISQSPGILKILHQIQRITPKSDADSVPKWKCQGPIPARHIWQVEDSTQISFNSYSLSSSSVQLMQLRTDKLFRCV